MKYGALAILMVTAALAHGAEMYRWVDEKGVVNYTPYPPPPNIRKVEPKKLGDTAKAAPATSDAPYSLQLATKNFPLTFYSTKDCGEPCKSARAHLEKRGAPFTEKDPSNPGSAKEFEDYKKMNGGNPQVPFLMVGTLKNLQGYLASEWDAALDAAGYPTSVPGAKPAAKPPAEKPPADAPAAAK